MEKEFFAVKNIHDEIRLKSSSGGIATTLSSHVLKLGGVVYGAIYNKDFKVIHTRITVEEDLGKMQGSKYVQSDFVSSFELIKKDLNDGRVVLFIGTPCQVKTIKNITKDCNQEKIFFVDLVCNGASTPDFFEEYKELMEKKYNSKIIGINMRHKLKYDSKHPYIANGPVQPHLMKIDFENRKKSYISKPEFDIFYQLLNYFIKKKCYTCPFTNLKREGDLTLGDFHEFHSKLGDFNDGNGVSLLIINSAKGKKLIDSVNKDFLFLSKTEQEAMQPRLKGNAILPKDYDQFHKDYKQYGFDYIVKKYTNTSIKYRIKKWLDEIGLLDKMLRLKGRIK